MNIPARYTLLVLPMILIGSTHAAVEDWFMDKAIVYRQSADDTQPSAAIAWVVEVAVATTNPGDVGAATISKVGSATEHSFFYEDGEWIFDKGYGSEAAMNLEFPSNSDYTITISGGTLGIQSQTFTLGPANYPNVPYLTGSDFSRVQSIDSSADFTLSWNDPGAFGSAISLEVEDRINGTCIVDAELDPPLPTSLLITASSFAPGYCYEGCHSFFNTVEASGVGGFGITGFIEHSSNLSFEIQTVLSPNVDAIVGAWQFGNGAANESGVLVFQANGVYFHAEDTSPGGDGTDGIETGTYTWNPVTGAFVATVLVDTNGDIGLSHPDGSDTFTVNGNTLNISDNSESFALQRVDFNSSSLIEGGWRLCDNSGSTTGVLVFLANGTYFHAELNDGGAFGADGIERGTYSWNSGSGALTATPIVDTNGDIGLSDPIGSFEVFISGPRVMMITDGEASFLHRVTNAAVLPEWRINKARSFNQIAENTAPSSVDFWDVFSLVQTRNASDAGQITLSGGNLPGSVSFDYEDPGIWTYEDEFVSQGLLDAVIPDGQVYTITLSGGELGTVVQTLNIGSAVYPTTPYLTGTNFTDAQSIDPTVDFDFDWNAPGGATIQLVVSSLVDEDGTIFYNEFFFGGTAQGTTLPGQSMPAGQTGFGYLEFATGATTSNGAGGFGVSGFSGRQSITFDFAVNAQSAGNLVDTAAADAGLVGGDAAFDATPFSDGVENLLKYAFNMNLGGPDSSNLVSGSGNSGLPAFALDDSGPATEFKVEFVRRKGSGLVYTAKRSFDLGGFSEMSGAVVVTPIDDQFERVVVSEPCDPGTTPRCFGYVEVTLP